jgi:HrpA-like RNA helicase
MLYNPTTQAKSAVRAGEVNIAEDNFFSYTLDNATSKDIAKQSHCHFSCRLHPNSTKPHIKVKVDVYGVYSHLLHTLQHNLLCNHTDSKQQLVVFTTNLTKTSLTLPNIHYIINTGLEWQVQWNPEANMNKMVTTPITQSLMTQHTGHTRHITLGICIHLYSKESVKAHKTSHPPEVQSGQALHGQKGGQQVPAQLFCPSLADCCPAQP